MLQLVFTCFVKDTATQCEIKKVHESIGKRCKAQGLSGFFVAHQGWSIGCFCGLEKSVFRQIEQFVRSKTVREIEVVAEQEVKTCSWPEWRADWLLLSDIPAAQLVHLPDLAQTLGNRLKAATYSLSR